MTHLDVRAEGAAADAHRAPAHRHLGLALTVICLAQLMVTLDATVVNVALPSIQRALHFSSANLIWVVNGYTLAFGGLLLLGGRTGDLFGRRRMFVVGVALFTLSSLAGGFAMSEGWLVGARVAQGLGGAICAPAALALIADTFPEGGPRNRAMGVYAALSGAGAAIGVLIGGALTSALGWRWVLFVNVPIGLLVVVATPIVLGESQTREGGLDLPGAVVSTAGMTLLVYGLIHAATTAWSDRWTIALLVAGAVLLASFAVVEMRSSHALMPLRILRSRNRAVIYGVVLATGTSIFSMFYFGTLFMQDVLGYGPLKSGLAYLAPSATIVVTAGLVSRVITRMGAKVFLVVGCALAAAGLFWLSAVTVTSSYAGGMLGPLLLTAAGMGLCFVPLTVGAVAGVDRHEQGIASAVLNAGQQIGGTLGLALLGSIAVAATKNQLTAFLHTLGPQAASVGAALSSGTSASGTPVPPAVHHALLGAEVHGYTTAFAIGGVVLVGALLLSLFGYRSGSGVAGDDVGMLDIAEGTPIEVPELA